MNTDQHRVAEEVGMRDDERERQPSAKGVTTHDADVGATELGVSLTRFGKPGYFLRERVLVRSNARVGTTVAAQMRSDGAVRVLHVVPHRFPGFRASSEPV